MKNYEEVSNLNLTDGDRETLLKTQNECVFTWRTSDGWPIGVAMSYVWQNGKVWLTASSQRSRFSGDIKRRYANSAGHRYYQRALRNSRRYRNEAMVLPRAGRGPDPE
jgi:hypothetical protein